MRTPLRSLALILATAALAATATLAATAARAADMMDTPNLVNVDAKGLALEGYDPVAFFTEGRPIRGVDQFTSAYRGATYHFVTAAHKQMFDKDPAKYEPQFGGFCAYAVSIGKTASVEIDTWSIVDGRLLLQHNDKAVRLWKEDVKGNLAKADHYWPAVAKNGGRQVKLDE